MGEMKYTKQEQKNIELVKEYMQIAYDPKRASAEAVAHLCANKQLVYRSQYVSSCPYIGGICPGSRRDYEAGKRSPLHQFRCSLRKRRQGVSEVHGTGKL